MDQLFIGKIVTTLAVGLPSGWFVGRIFYDIMKLKIIDWAKGWGYMTAISDMKELGLLKEEDIEEGSISARDFGAG